MHLFRRTWPDEHGNIRMAKRWTVQLGVEANRAKIVLFTNRRASEVAAARIEELAASRASGMPVSAELQDWVLQAPERLRRSLLRHGLADEGRLELLRPLDDLLPLFRRAMLARGTTEQHARETFHAAERVFRGAGAKRWSDIKAGAVEAFLAEERECSGLSHRTSNKLAGAARAFTRWIQRSGWASDDPLRSLRTLPVDADRRRIRRPFTLDEVRKLVVSTDQGPERRGLSGPERVALYLLAVETGLRRAELFRLHVGDLELRVADGPAVLSLRGSASKNRRGATFPLREATAERLRYIVAGLSPDAPLFSPYAKFERALQADLEAAKVAEHDDDWRPVPDENGRIVDFHSFRYTLATELVRGGLPLAQVQKYLRHSSAALTLGTYTQLGADDAERALGHLPELDADEGDEP